MLFMVSSYASEMARLLSHLLRRHGGNILILGGCALVLECHLQLLTMVNSNYLYAKWDGKSIL
jgi:hypothetical protein